MDIKISMTDDAISLITANPVSTILKEKHGIHNAFCINLSTVIRAVLSQLKGTATLDELFPYITNTLSALVEGIIMYSNASPSKDIVILFYASSYVINDQTMQRSQAINTGAQVIVNNIYRNQKAITNIETSINSIVEVAAKDQSKVHLIFNIDKSKTDVSLSLQQLLQQKQLKSAINDRVNAIVISNIPSDYYLSNDITFSVLSLFTGDIWIKASISEKIFDDLAIPFSNITHVLFGDRYTIKPLLKGKIKDEILELFKKYYQSQLTPGLIQNIIRNYDDKLYKELIRRLSVLNS